MVTAGVPCDTADNAVATKVERHGVALVTGASRGIGRAISEALARSGFDVAVAARTLRAGEAHRHGADGTADQTSLPGSLEETAAAVRAAGRSAICVPMDLTDEEGAIAAIAEATAVLGSIDVLVNNAIYKGPGTERRVLDLTSRELAYLTSGNLQTQVAITRALLPGMMARGRGAIVQLTSGSTEIKPTIPVDEGGWDFGYAATKAAISKLIPLLAVEHPFEKCGVRFFNLEPGLVVTELMKSRGTADRYRKFGDVPPGVIGAAVAHLVTAPFDEVRKYSGAPFVFAPKLVSDLALLPGYTYVERIPTARVSAKSTDLKEKLRNAEHLYPYPPEELQLAYARYCEVKNRCSRTQSWSEFADLFTDDCFYCEHAYGEFHGRQAVRDYIVRAMAPYPDMTFPHDWHVFDYERGAVLALVQNTLPPPEDHATGKPFQIPNISRLVYGGGGLWKEQQDWYNPLLHAKQAVAAWRQAGGAFKADELLNMRYSTPGRPGSKL